MLLVFKSICVCVCVHRTNLSLIRGTRSYAGDVRDAYNLQFSVVQNVYLHSLN